MYFFSCTCCVRDGSGVQTVQQLPTKLAPAANRGKYTTHKTLKTTCNARPWPRKCWKSCTNGSNILRYASAIMEQKKCWKLLAQTFD